ncbi:nucleotide exchange factor GrpE [Mycoplasma hafezii]|uniref:nucleotide exchange factor GrpE n=1 Tax=Mycoplasma hafezii TaxID=525886 RepID=UPI003CF4662E
MKTNKISVNDIVKGKFDLYVEGTHQPEYSGDKEIVIGQEQFLPQFDEKILNRKYKRHLEIKFTFPKDYEIQEFQRKTALVLINNIEVLSPEKEETKATKEAKQDDAKLKELEARISELENKLNEKDTQIRVMEYSFKEKADELTKKATEKLNEKINELQNKTNETIKEKQAYALARFIEDLEVPFNNLAMATKAGENSDNIQVKNYCIGFSMVVSQFEQVFSDHNIQLITPELGTEFDANISQIVDWGYMPELKNHVVLKVVRQGIKIADRVVKPASVIVNKLD